MTDLAHSTIGASISPESFLHDIFTYEDIIRITDLESEEFSEMGVENRLRLINSITTVFEGGTNIQGKDAVTTFLWDVVNTLDDGGMKHQEDILSVVSDVRSYALAALLDIEASEVINPNFFVNYLFNPNVSRDDKLLLWDEISDRILMYMTFVDVFSYVSVIEKLFLKSSPFSSKGRTYRKLLIAGVSRFLEALKRSSTVAFCREDDQRVVALHDQDGHVDDHCTAIDLLNKGRNFREELNIMDGYIYFILRAIYDYYPSMNKPYRLLPLYSALDVERSFRLEN